MILANDGRAGFTWDRAALATSTDHSRRAVEGVAVGDLNEDGFVDIVSVSNHDYPQPLPMALNPPVGSIFDEVAYFWPTWVPTGDPIRLAPNPALPPLPNGGLSGPLRSRSALLL